MGVQEEGVLALGDWATTNEVVDVEEDDFAADGGLDLPSILLHIQPYQAYHPPIIIHNA